MPSLDLEAKLRKVKLVVSDVDGTLARRIYLDNKGKEIKVFCEKDAPRILAVIKCGIPFVMISGRDSPAARVRAKELKAAFYYRKEMVDLRGDALSFLEKRYGVLRSEMLYIGDDWPDIWWMKQVLISAAPADAEEICRVTATFIAKTNGGEGAVSEILTLLLKAIGEYDLIVQNF